MRIFLVRHGESAANVDKRLHKSMADHAIPLSDKGQKQALDAGKFLGEYFHNLFGLEKDTNIEYDLKTHSVIGFYQSHVRIWVSPYERTRETANGIFQGIDDYQQNHGNIYISMDRRENIRLCEQQFGLFDGIPDDERGNYFPEEAAHYEKCESHEGRFWARMPLGESRFDVANRVYQTFGTFHRDREKKGIENIVVICHGVTLRAFVMQWLHLTPEWFDNEPNPGNCDIRLIEDNKDKGYVWRS